MENTNNVMNVLSFVTYTDIATMRSASAPLGDWNVSSDPYSNLKKLISEGNGKTNFESFSTNKLFAYADLIHNFGPQSFMLFLRSMFGFEPSPYLNKETQILGKSSYLREDDGFALFASQYFKKDFVNYFTNIWHLNLSSETISKIKALGYEEFFSFGCLFAKGLKGVETGRYYKINVGIENVLDFNKFSLCSAGDVFELESLTTPKNGTLTEKEKGVYIYQPNPNFVSDNFEAKFKFNINGETYYRVLPIELRSNINFIEKITYEVPNNKSIDEAVSLISDDKITDSSLASNFTSSVIQGVNLTLFRAQVMFDKSQQMTFMVYGDDKTLIKINDQVGKLNGYNESLDSAKNSNGNKITLEVVAGEPFIIEAYCYNTGGNGKLYVKYSTDGENYNDIPFENCYYYRADKSQIEESIVTELPIYDTTIDLTENYLNNFYSNNLNVKKPIVSVKCVTAEGKNVPPSGSDRKIEDIADENSSTWFYSTYNNPPAFPHYYVMELKEGTTFNTVTVDHYNGDNYYIGDFTLYTSEDMQTYNKVYEGKNTQRLMEVHLENFITPKYFILEVKNNRIENQNAIVIRDIYFSESLDLTQDYNLYNSHHPAFISDNNWTNKVGGYTNGLARETSAGKVRFLLTGTEFSLYSINKNQNSKIIIDGTTHPIIVNSSVRSPNFVIGNLSDEEHLIEIDANDFIFDAVKTSGTIKSPYLLSSESVIVSKNGKTSKPKPILTYGDTTLVENVDYKIIKLTYKNGICSYKVEGINRYAGTIEGHFIYPAEGLSTTIIIVISVSAAAVVGISAVIAVVFTRKKRKYKKIENN